MDKINCENMNTECLLENFCRDEVMAQDWYFARWYVRYRMPKFWDVSIGVKSNKHLHIVLYGTSPRMMAIARQLALYAHYPNFEDETGRNCTLITFVVPKNERTKAEKKLEEYLGGFYAYCKEFTAYTFLDIRIQVQEKISGTGGDEVSIGKDEKPIVLKEEDIAKDFVLYSRGHLSIDELTWAKQINIVYTMGEEMDDLVVTNPTNKSAFIHALRHYLSKVNDKESYEKEWEKCSVVNKLSSLFCADSRYHRLLSIIESQEIKKLKLSESFNLEQKLYHVLRCHPKDIRDYLEDEANIIAFSKMEHARWNIAQLVLGFRPMSAEELLYAHRFQTTKQRHNYYNMCKKRAEDPSHVAICSYRNLTRLKPEDRKFDAFLVLGILEILIEQHSQSFLSRLCGKMK